MEYLSEAFEHLKELVNPESIIKYGGLALLTFVIFAETGILLGFFLPGDSLLFTAGLLSANPTLEMPIWKVLLFVSIAAVLGDSFGYYLGKKYGVKVFSRPNSRFFKPEYVTITKQFYAKHGAKTLIIGRFLPIIRTFAPVLAGVVQLEYKKFISYNVIGGILWVWSLSLLGYFLGTTFPQIKKYYEFIVLGFIIVTAIPVIRVWLQERKGKKDENSPLNAEAIEAAFQAKVAEENSTKS